MFAQRNAIHVSGDQGIGVEGLLNRYAADEGRHFAGDFVEPAEHYVLAAGFEAGSLQNIAQARPGKARCAHGPLAPLNAGDLRALQGAAISGALQSVDHGVSFNLTEFAEGNRQGFLDFATDGEFPLLRIQFAGLVHVIANEEVRNWGKPGIKEFYRGLEIEEAIGAHDQIIFPRNLDAIFGKRRTPGPNRWQSARHKGGLGDLRKEFSS